MIKKISVLLAATFFLFSGNVFAVSSTEAESICRQYASEDGVAEDELNDYIAQCILDLQAEAAQSSD